MTDETRDALLLALAEVLTEIIATGMDQRHREMAYKRLTGLLDRARHEQQYPEDRG